MQHVIYPSTSDKWLVFFPTKVAFFPNKLVWRRKLSKILPQIPGFSDFFQKIANLGKVGCILCTYIIQPGTMLHCSGFHFYVGIIIVICGTVGCLWVGCHVVVLPVQEGTFCGVSRLEGFLLKRK